MFHHDQFAHLQHVSIELAKRAGEIMFGVVTGTLGEEDLVTMVEGAHKAQNLFELTACNLVIMAMEANRVAKQPQRG